MEAKGFFLMPKSALTANKTTLALTHQAHTFMLILIKKTLLSTQPV